MGNENNIFIRITGETNADAVTKKLNAQRAELEQLEKDLVQLAKAEVESDAAMKKYANTTSDVAAEMKKVNEEHKRLKKIKEEEIESTKKAIHTLEANAKAANLLAGSTKSVMSQLREMREAMMEMEEAGMENSKAYEELAIKSARLTDAQGDLQQRIRILASDTMQLDGLMSGGSGLAGAFNTATSAAELLGGETEGLQKAFYKVQATLSVLNGVQEVANALNKDSAFRVVASANAQKMYNWALGGTSKALKVLRVSMLALGLPALIIAVAGLVAHFDQLNEKIGVSNETWSKFKQAAMGALEVIKGTLANIGEGVVKLLQGDFSGAWDAFKKTADVSTKYAAGVAKEAAAQAINLTNKVYELAMAQNQRAQALYSKSLEEGLRTINKAQLAAKSAMSARHASDVEMAQEELAYAKERAAITQESNEKAIAANEKEVAAAQRLMNAKQKALNAEKNGTQQYLDALNEYNDAQSTYINAVQKTTDLRQAIDDANQEVIDAGISLQQAIEAQQVELVNARIAIMREGKEKEIEQIEANYAEQFKSIQGNSEQEIALRKTLEEKKEREIQQVRLQYAKEETDVALNHQLAMAQIELNTSRSPRQKMDALKKQLDAQKAVYQNQEDWLNAQRAAGLISESDYQSQILELTRNRIQAEISMETEKLQVISEAFQSTLSYMQQVSDMVFDALNSGVQSELDDLDKYYTTDATEAAKNSKKKLITEQEYEKKKAALEMKQARYAKAQALTNIGINTAMAIMTTLAQLGATPWGIAMASVAGVMGAAQLAVAAAKPLAQYAKGRKGGKGEYAMVGEKGAEIMYVPEGASIIPHHLIDQQDKWSQFGVPALPVPELPNFNSDDVSKVVMMHQLGSNIDYDKLGRAVAANIPQQKALTINVDKSGIRVQDGLSTRTYLNTKYAGTWH